MEARAWHLLATEEAIRFLKSSPEGLSEEDASTRLAQYGPNRLEEAPGFPGWKRFLLQFHSALIYVLIVTAGVTALLSQWVDTGVILGVIIVNGIIGFVQESKAEQAIESLRHMLSPVAMVLRSGKRISVPASELVPGDLVFLQSGDKVPADLRLTDVKNLHIDEAALTGESVPQTKHPETLAGHASLGDRKNLAFAGTLVTTGAARGLVVATGNETELGQIAGMLEKVEGVDTPLIRRLGAFSRVITVAIVVFCGAVFGLGLLTGKEPVQMLMASVALAVSAIPEGLPAIMTIALAISVKRMAARSAVVRKLPAVEALGSVTVICTDKTGTLTKNEMTVTQIATDEGRFQVSGSGYEPVGCISGDDCAPNDAVQLHELILAASLCNEAALRHRDGQWTVEGDPTEGSLIVLAEKGGQQHDELLRRWPRMDEIPFESERQFMATLHHDHEGHAMIYLKGSPEKVLSLCHEVETSRWETTASEMASEGLRVLAIAEKKARANHTVLEFDDVGDGFSLLGLVGMMDPPRQAAIASVKRCRAAGIQVKMITGDHVETARTVARQLGMQDSDRAMSGIEMDELTGEAFDRATAEINVFARVSPEHKLRLVQSLQRSGEVVSMTGDGVNDAPALKQADIGVAMGITGTDVSKEAAEMVLLNDDFSSIEHAVEEGRTVFNNLKKTILFILPTNGGECLTLVAAIILGWTLPILPLHILWINLITTVALAITLAFDPVDRNVMKRPPRDPRQALIDRPVLWRIIYVSILMGTGIFLLFFYEIGQGRSEEVARCVAVNAMVFFEVVYVFNTRRFEDSVINLAGLTGNRIIWMGVAVVVAFQMLFTYWPGSHRLFDVEPLDLGMWIRVLGAAVTLFLLVEGEKAISRWWNRRSNARTSGE